MNDKEKVYKYIDDYFKQIDVNHFLDNKILGRYVDSYLPFYDEYADFNTNAKSYYDYLARYNRILKLYSDLINRLLRRNIEVEDTKTIEFLKFGDWIDNGKCIPDNFDDLIKLLANVKISQGQETKFFKYIADKPYNIKNSIKEKDDGIWAADFTGVLEDIGYIINDLRIKDQDQDDKLDELKKKDEEQDNRLDDLEDIVDNLQGLNLTELVKNKDYKITFHNGFYSPESDLIVLAGETKETMDIKVVSDSGKGKAIKHDGDIREKTVVSLRPGKDIPEKSKVFSIKFLGKYEYLNNLEVGLDKTNDVLWHMRPLKARASWTNLLTPHNINNEFVWSWRQINDGYGSQLSNYYDEPLSIQWGNIDTTITLMK